MSQAGIAEARSRENGLPRSISERDIAVLVWIGEQYAASQDQITRLREASPTTTTRWRRRFEDAGLLESAKFVTGLPPVAWLTRRGLYHAGLSELKPLMPSLAKLNHTVAVGDVRLAVADRHPEAVWISERKLAKEVGHDTHLADGEVLLPGGKIVAIEIEIAVKHRPRLVEIVEQLVNRYDAVWYFASPQAKRQLVRVAEEQDFGRLQILDLPSMQ